MQRRSFKGINCIIADSAILGEAVSIGHNCIIEEGVKIGRGSRIDSNTIIRYGTKIGCNSFIGSNCIIGEYQNDYIQGGSRGDYHLSIGENCLIRSGSILYSNSEIGDNFQTGHQVTIREKSKIGNNVNIGTLSDIQELCSIGDYVRIHSNVFIGQYSVINDFVWIYSHTVLTNDPTPPSYQWRGVHIHSFAVVAASSLLLPGVEIGQDALVGAGAVVTRDVGAYKVVLGNPAKEVADVRRIKNRANGKPAYPWRDNYSRYMPWDESTFEEWYNSLSNEDKPFLVHDFESGKSDGEFLGGGKYLSSIFTVFCSEPAEAA